MREKTNTNTKAKAKGFQLKLIALTIVPLLIASVIICAVSIVKMSNSMTNLSKEKVESVARAIVECYDGLYPGNWEYEGGVLSKGGENVTAAYGMLDKIYEEDGVHCTIFYGDTRVLTTIKDENGKRLEGTKTGEQVIQTVLENGESYFSTNTEINGEEYYSFYEPLKNSDDRIVGMFFVGVTRATVNDMLNGTIGSLLITTIIVLLIDAGIVLWASMKIAKAINNCAKAIVELESGTLDIHAEVESLNKNDELGILAESINALAEKFREITGKIKSGTDVMRENIETMSGVAENTNDSIEEVSRAIEDVAKGATEQAGDTQDAVNGIDDMGMSVDAIAGEIEALAEFAGNAQKTSEKAGNTMQELLHINTETKESVDRIVEQSRSNMEAAAKIQDIVKVISDIASQTNLLSLNASIEAARAGEMGKGFAVVALEVGNLAESSSESAKEIENIIKDLVEKISETSELTDALNSNTNDQIAKLEETSKDFEGMRADVGKIFDETAEIQAEIEKIAQVKENIVQIIEGLSAISEENAASSEETTASANIVVASMAELHQSAQKIGVLAEELAELVAYFK